MARLTGIAVVLMLLMVVGIFAAGCAKKKVVDETATPQPIQIPQMDDEATEDEGTGDDGTEEGAETEFTYVCPEHADETSDDPAKCSVCDAYMVADTDEVVEYYCAMCDDGAQDEPGCCEACGEDCALVARLVTDAGDDDGDDDEGSEHEDDDGDGDDHDPDDDDDDEDEGTA